MQDGAILALDPETLRVVDVRGGEGAFGYGREELLALDAFALFPRWWNAAKTLDPVVTLCKPKRGPFVPVNISFARGEHESREVIIAEVRNRPPLTDVEKELESTNAYLHAIVENIPDMIFVKDAKTHAFKRFNRAGEELLGHTRGTLLGKTDHDFYPREQADFFHLKDDETMRAGVIVDIPQEPITTLHKGLRVLHTRKIPIYDAAGAPLYLLGISEDITARIQAEQMAREFADVMKHAPEAIVAWAQDGTILSWNPAAERLYGIPASAAIGTSFLRFVPEAEHERFSATCRALREGSEVGVLEVVRIRADGREIEIEESTFVVRDAQGDAVRIAAMARDVTELARLRRATRLLTRGSVPPLADENVAPEMAEALRHADLVAADTNATVLLLGETGVGKSHLARRIHQQSPRSGKPFFEVNCATLARELVESELFGHERGAFTGAVAQKRGLVETAEGGTLFLDEIGELPPAVQAQLLTFLDTKTFRRVGSTRTITANVRLLAATNADLKLAVADNRFRSDLYYRLSVVPITVPPLRARRSEIADLAKTILDDLSARRGRKGMRLEREALRALERYPWPGNIRELRNALERALILTAPAALGHGDRIGLDQLPPEIRDPQPAARATETSLDAVTRDHILEALRETGGNRTRAAERLGISRSTLKRKLAEMRAGSK